MPLGVLGVPFTPPPVGWMTSKCRPDGPAFRFLPDWRVEIGDPDGAGGYKPRPIKVAASWPAKVDDWRVLIEKASADHQVPANVVAAIMAFESGGDAKAGSYAGAIGLMQLLLETARSLAGDPALTREQILEPDRNVDLGAKLLAQLWAKHAGNLLHVVVAYNAGGVYCGGPWCKVTDPATGKIVKTGAAGKSNEWNLRDDCAWDAKAKGCSEPCRSVDYPGRVLALNNEAVAAGYGGILMQPPPPPPPPPPPMTSPRSGAFQLAAVVGGVAGVLALLGWIAARPVALPAAMGVLEATVPKLSPTQGETLRRMAGTMSGRIFRLPGGFWTVDDVPVAERAGTLVPAWFADVRTVRVLERCGLVARTSKFPEEWRDDRVITAAGRVAVT